MMITDEVKEAKENYKKAAIALIEAVKIAYPVGCIVGVTMGRARLRAKVTGHSSSWWYNPGTVFIENVVTGKSRDFDATSGRFEAEVLS